MAVAEAHLEYDAKIDAVWAAITDPDKIAVWMAGAVVDTPWEVGAPITWSVLADGVEHLDTGRVVEVEEPTRLVVTHRSGDGPEHTVTFALESLGGTRTRLVLTQDGAADEDEAARSAQDWESMLTGLGAAL